MAITLNHTIVPAHDKEASAKFLAHMFGLHYEGAMSHFAPVKVNETLTLDFDTWDRFEMHHYAFHVSDAEFDAIFGRIKEAEIPYGDRFDRVGNMQGPGDEAASRGMGKAVYFFDPDQHLIEIRHYGAA